MLGVYAHIPYCKSVCPYCDFNSYVDPKPRWQAFATAIERELAAHASQFYGPSRSVYFGGGTPSLAPAWLIGRVIASVRDTLGLVPDAEITLEANPGTVSAALFAELRAVGVNRISLGWQSTHDHLLRVLGRGHSAQDSEQAFQWARAAGFTNISADLIFAVPGQTLMDLEHDLDRLLAHAPEHISLYNLTYHEDTPFFRWKQQGRLQPADEDTEVAMMDCIAARLEGAGYEHYEVSNYARPGHRAVHNTLYWTGAQYLGLGPGAHSFCHRAWQGGERWEGLRDPNTYMQAWLADERRVEWRETLSARQLLTERMLCSLRVQDGIDLRELREVTAWQPHAAELSAGIAAAHAKGWVVEEHERLIPTPSGLRHADALAALFF